MPQGGGLAPMVGRVISGMKEGNLKKIHEPNIFSIIRDTKKRIPIFLEKNDNVTKCSFNFLLHFSFGGAICVKLVLKTLQCSDIITNFRLHMKCSVIT